MLKKRKTNAGGKVVEISGYPTYQGPIYNAELPRFIINRHAVISLFLALLLIPSSLVCFSNQATLLGIILDSIFLIFLLFFIWGYNKNQDLGELEMSPYLEKFLNRFGRTRGINIAGFSEVIWRIEYDILIMACEWHEKDPQGFLKETMKAKNKKELRWILGIS